MKALLYGLLLLVCGSGLAIASMETYRFENAQQQARYRVIIETVRCTVCQGQTIADSNAGLAQDLRQLVYEMIIDGHSDREIYRFMVERYGEMVLYRPPLKPSTIPLWIGPFVILGVALVALVMIIRRRERLLTPKLSSDELQRASQLLEQDKK